MTNAKTHEENQPDCNVQKLVKLLDQPVPGIELSYIKLNEDAEEPTYATAGAACFDLYSTDDGTVDDENPQQIFGTGLAFQIPLGHVMLIYSRSGHGFKNRVRLSNGTGVIDSDYRGEVKITLTADRGGQLTVSKGDRIAQAMVVPVEPVAFKQVETLTTTQRGDGGFGHTGN